MSLEPATYDQAMSVAQPDPRGVRFFGIGIAVLFTVALTALLGELVGAFADSPASFIPYFDSVEERLRHASGAYFLAGSGLAFMAFTVRGTSSFETSDTRTDARVACLAAAVFAALVGLGAAALATVSLSLGFGQITGDPGIRETQELLPQLGYVVLFVPAALSAALVILLMARSPGGCRWC